MVTGDIFGSDKSKQKGLVDCGSKTAFRDACEKIYVTWDSLEESLFPESKSQFSTYFSNYIADDIESGMLKDLREYLGLGGGFFFNNAQECSNKKLKSRIKETKVKTSFGYCPPLKCSWVDGIRHYEAFVLSENKKTLQAIIGKGPFRISSEYPELEIAEHTWNEMTPESRRMHFIKVNKMAKYMISSDVLVTE